MYGNEGDDTLIGGAGNDRYDGGEGTDTVILDNELSADVDLSVVGRWFNTGDGWDRFDDIENLVTGSGHDKLTGNDEGNRFESGAGDDRLYGRAGDDTLIGGAGDDRLSGGSGDDVFRFYRSEGLSTDTITDFSAGDSIELVNDTGEEELSFQITNYDNQSTITYDELTIVFEGVYINYDDINPIG